MSPKPEIVELEKSKQLAIAIAAWNDTLSCTPENPYNPKIKCEQVSVKGHDVVVELRRREGFKNEDIKYIMAMADSLNGTVSFLQTGEINVSF